MSIKSFLPVVALGIASGLVGCNSDPAADAAAQAAAEAAATQAAAKEAIPNPIPDSSPFAKIKIGMQDDQVQAILGQPTYRGSYVTGKAYIPFHFGGDNVRTILRYKGQGYIVLSQDHAFTGSQSVQTIFYDPTEPGFERK